MIRRVEVCVDAGLAIKEAVIEPDSPQADALFRHWSKSPTRLIAPRFFQVETDSILRQKVVLRRELNPDEAEAAYVRLRALKIQSMEVTGQRQRAWEIARQFDMPTVYDATYLALAEIRGCEFWTADERLVKRVRGELGFVRWLGDFRPRVSAGRTQD